MEEKRVDPLRQNILEAVDCLRQRKCRPDRESIAHYVLRKFGSTMNEIFAELENIVDENGLIKVEYKGTTSYRSPSSFDTKNSPLLTKHSKILNSSKTTRYIITGINELLVKDPNYAKEGVPLDELKATLVGFDAVRFGEENMEIVLEREKNYGNIQIAKSTVLDNSMRVFPKDIPVPADMIKISLSSEIVPGEKEEKKPRKPRKSSLPSDGDTATPPKKGKANIKKEAVEDSPVVAVFAVKSDPPPPCETEDSTNNELSPVPKKNPRVTTGRKSGAAAAETSVGNETAAVKTDFASRSAQMIKLAAAVVSRQVEEAMKPKGPTLVLAESIKGKSSNGDAGHETETPETVPQEKPAKKRRGRPPAETSAAKEESVKEEKVEKEIKQEKVSPSSDQGLTRSKRDKRKKQVFDPSDLPKTYTHYSIYAKSTPKSRATRSPSYEEPPPKKQKAAVTPRSSRASQRKSPIVKSPVVKEKRNSRSNSKKAATNKIHAEAVQISKIDPPHETERMDTGDTASTEEETLTTEELQTHDNIEADQTIKVVNEPSAPPDSSSKSKQPAPTKVEKRCEYCRSINKDTPNVDEELLTCASCQANIHPTCMGYSSELTLRIMELDKREGSKRIPWKCFDCKTCGVCQERLFGSVAANSTKKSVPNISPKSERNDNSHTLEFCLCEQCDVGFHAKCIEVDPENAKKETWVCESCRGAEKSDVKTEVVPGKIKITKKPKAKKKRKALCVKKKGAATVAGRGRSLRLAKAKAKLNVKSELPSPIIVKPDVDEESKSVPNDNSNSKLEENAENGTLDIPSWSPSDVEAFFIEKGLKDEAAILREQDVDGYSLLLLRREDIIDGLGLRLGPALKVNRLILELQSKSTVRAKWHDAETAEKESVDTSQNLNNT